VQKKGKERGRWFFTSPPFFLLCLLTLSSLIWVFNREPPVKDLKDGELNQILKFDDPDVSYPRLAWRRGMDVRGEITTADPVSKGIAAPERKEESLSFRARTDLSADAVLLRLVKERGGRNFQIEEDDTILRSIGSLIMSMLMIFFVLGAGFLLFRWVAGGNSPLTFGRSRHKLYAQKDLKITFADVAGIDEAVAELREIVDFLKTPDKYQALGGRIPKGVLLVGTPGTGKTLLAKAVAGEADVPFFSMSGSDFVELFVGVGASRVRDLFQQAETRAPCIIFIDELDALGKTRGGTAIGGHDEREQTLNALLVEMDGFDSNRGVIIMAATNRPETLDPALLRPGRFDRTVVVDRPDVAGREAILKVHIRNVKLGADVDLRHVASLTPGSVGADLANLVNEAALLAARNSKEAVGMPEFNEAIERMAMGLERKSRIMAPDQKRRTAVHESGHALVACSLPNSDPVHKVTIIPRGVGALGYVLQRPEDDQFSWTRSQLESRIKVALGGTIAEEIVFDEIATGASSDLDKANNMARRMVTEFGMSRLGRVYYPDQGDNPFLPGAGLLDGRREYSEQTAREIDLEVRQIVDAALQEVRTILRARRGALDALAQMLFDKEVIDGAELHALLDTHPVDVSKDGQVPSAQTAEPVHGLITKPAATPVL